MKPFTYAQKKWVTATALLAVLAVNVSLNPQKPMSGSADLAAKAPEANIEFVSELRELVEKSSKAPIKTETKKKNKTEKTVVEAEEDGDSNLELVVEDEGEKTLAVKEIEVPTKVEEVSTRKVKIPTRNGTISVKYIDNGDNEFLAIVPKKNTEGKICPTCGYETVSLKVDKSDIDSLNVELLKVWDKKKTKVIEEATTEVTAEKEKENEDSEVAEEKGPFDGISEKCEKKSAEEQVLECIKDKFLKVVKDKKAAKDITPGEALKFYKTEIQSRLLKQVNDAKRIAARSRNSALSQSSFISFIDSADSDLNPEEMMVAVSNIISELIEEVPSKFESVRKSLVAAESDMLKYEAAKLKETHKQAMTSPFPSEAARLIGETQALSEELNFMRNEFYFRNEGSLDNAYSNKNISGDLHDQYLKYFSEFNTNMVNGLLGQNKFLETVNLNTSPELLSRLGSPGRGQGTLGTNPAISSRTGGALANTSNRTVLVPVSVQSNGLVIPSTNTGLSFSPLGEATADQIRMREAIRSRLNRN